MEWKWEDGESTLRFQLVKFKGQTYVMKRIGFGLSVALKVLAQDSCISEGTDHYIDGIWVDESVVTAEEVRWLLVKEIPTKHELFSMSGKLIGHYPVAGWLRPAGSYLKRQTNEIGWDEEIPVPVRALAKEVMNRILQHDPVDGSIVEDATWLRKVDGSHINVTELGAVIKGLNIALHWGIAKLKIVIDSASVHDWVRSILVNSKRPKVSGLSEMVIKRRLRSISQLVMKYHIKMTIQLVPSTSNKADELTRVPQKRLNSAYLAVVTLDDKTREVTTLHGKHHLGVEKTLYLAQRVGGQNMNEKVVKQWVDFCNQCRRVDPISVKWNHGRLSVDKRRLPNETAAAVAKELNRIFLERGAPDEVLCDNGPCFRSLR
ncbi:uncharacterized protein [Watersipora subatra]|uniref:uncharacterized protein n=1 Tax=Watersipora subatra TaxID=2589382 RepID=UPI00355B931D